MTALEHALRLALAHAVKPQEVMTVFAGQDLDAFFNASFPDLVWQVFSLVLLLLGALMLFARRPIGWGVGVVMLALATAGCEMRAEIDRVVAEVKPPEPLKVGVQRAVYVTDSAADARAAFRTLHDALRTLALLLAPPTPFTADWLHRALSGGESAHLCRLPGVDESLQDPALERGMEAARALSTLGRAARERVRIRVRQPLGVLYAVVPDADDVSGDLLEILRDELSLAMALAGCRSIAEVTPVVSTCPACPLWENVPVPSFSRTMSGPLFA